MAAPRKPAAVSPQNATYEMKSAEASDDPMLSASPDEGSSMEDGGIGGLSTTKSTVFDARNMQRMGRAQQLIRHFRLFSTVCFVAIATANWELSIFAVTQGLVDGGRPSLIWAYVWNFFGFTPIILSMAEMASMAPIAGAQYHWVSEFASPRWQKQLSYFTGWMSTLAWQAGNAQGLFITGTLIQTLIQINNPNYSNPRWEGSLLIIAVAILTLVLNILFNQYLPYAQNVLFVAHVLLYLCFIIPIWVLSPRVTAEVAFTDFTNLGGWPNMGLAVLAGQLSGIAFGTGVDTAAHMSEEINDAGRNVPTAMVYAYIVNAVLSIPAIITLCFAVTDIEAAITDPTNYAVVWVLRNTMSTGWMTAFLSAIILLLSFSNVSYLAAVARDLFAFARDNGLPFSPWIAKVHPKYIIPVNALIVSCVVAGCLSLIYIGSAVAFYALTSLFVVAILQCYMFSIGSLLWRRIKYPETLPPARWSLGRWGVPVNIAALIYVFWAFFWAFWPVFYQPAPKDFNWAVVLFGGVALLSLVLYIFKARFVYTGPVVLVQGKRNSSTRSPAKF